MSATERTEHYGLPIYKGEDKLNILIDGNGAMRTIDTTMYEIATQVATDGENIQGVQTLAGETKERTDANETAIGALDGRQTASENQIVTLVNGYNAVTNRVDNIDSAVDGITEKANTAVNKADNAQVTANEAKGASETATETAAEARSTAVNADSKAESASVKADNAASAASDAMERANEAYNLAGSMGSIATEAGNTAIKAQKLANTLATNIPLKYNWGSESAVNVQATIDTEKLAVVGKVMAPMTGLYSFEVEIDSWPYSIPEGTTMTMQMKVMAIAGSSSSPVYSTVVDLSKTGKVGYGDFGGNYVIVSQPVPIYIEDTNFKPQYNIICGIYIHEDTTKTRSAIVKGRMKLWAERS